MQIKHNKTGLKVYFNPSQTQVLKMPAPSKQPKQNITNPKLTIQVNNKVIPYQVGERSSIPESPYKTFQLIPHTDIKNEKIHQFADIIADSYREMFERFRNKKFEDQDKIFFETVMTNKSYQTFVTTQTDLVDMVKQQSRLIWKNVTVKDQTKPTYKLSDQGLGYDIQLKYPYFLSLKTDKKMTVTPLNELLEISQFMKGSDKVIIQFGFQSAEDGWYKDAAEQQESFERKPPRQWKNEKFKESTIMKSTHPGFDFSLRLYVYSNDNRRKHRIARSVILSLKQLNYDNELQEKMIKPLKMKKWMEDFKSYKIKVPFLFGKRYIITPPEIGHFIKLPQNQLQKEYPIIDTVSSKEMKIPDVVTKPGLSLGDSEYRGKYTPVSMPINNWDELCLPTAVIGGMGQGKTKGFGANRMVQAVRNGFGALFIDPAKHEVSNELKKVLHRDEYEIINVKNLKPSFDWVETNYSEYGKGLLADAVLSFFEDLEDTPQTERYLRAFVIGMKSTKLSEIFEIMEDKEYLKEVIEGMKDGIHKKTLQQYANESEQMRLRIIKPIYNRLDAIMGDPFLMECFESNTSLDFVEILSRKKAVVIDVAKKDGLTKKQINLIGNLLMTKINLAMQFRKDEDQFPYFVIVDEPHQFNRSGKLWESMAVESRKWRVAFIWLFHNWGQIKPKEVRDSIKSALPHYHIYPSSKETFIELKEEMEPFIISDFMKLKRWHAINILRVDGETQKPFIAKMTPPPSENKKIKTFLSKVS